MKIKKNVLDLTNTEAREFFLSEERYFTFDLPKYFTFNKLLKKIAEELGDKELSNFYDQYETTKTDGSKETKKHSPNFFDEVNYKLFNNKNGEYSWRLFQLIHPAIYVSLVSKITKDENWNIILNIFKKFKKNNLVDCVSLPVIKTKKQKTEKGEQILTWCEKVEKKSISLSLEYNYIFHTDIVDCYGSIYTHSIPWALHTKEISKKKRSFKKLLGNNIDWSLQAMSNGQTNGIPEGSILMDFIAEIVLGYADEKLTEKVVELKITNKDFKIIRYRDDYRIFVNNPEIGKQIIKELSIVLSDLGMKISSEKTIFSNDVIKSSIKPDKLFWITNSSKNWNIEKHLLIIKSLSEKYKNSGTLTTELQHFYKKIYKSLSFRNTEVLISIIIDIAFKNPRTYPISISILGKIISTLKTKKKKKEFIEKVENKIKKLPNTEVVDLWLQRLTLNLYKNKKYQGNLSNKLTNNNVKIWNSKWLNEDFQKILNETSIIDKKAIEKMDSYPSIEEVSLFESKGGYYRQ